MNQEIRFCTASYHVRLAYARVGHGPPLVKVANWLSHLEYDWTSPVWQPWLKAWSRYHTLYRYDQRGCGLSDRTGVDFSFDALVGDLETVVDAAGLEKFVLFGMSQGGSVAIAYAARHPERVSTLVIYGGYVRGRLQRNPSPAERESAEMDLRLLALAWGTENPAYRQVFTTFLIPEGTPEQITWFNELQRVSTSAENAVKLERTFNRVDVRNEAIKIRVPTLVLQAQDDAAVPFEEGRLTAACIPSSRFASIESRNHVLLAHEPAWPTFWQQVYRFLGVEAAETRGMDMTPNQVQEKVLEELSSREQEVLRLVAQGFQNAEIARRLVLSEKTVRNYISSIYAKLRINSRGEAIVLARKGGLVSDKT